MNVKSERIRHSISAHAARLSAKAGTSGGSWSSGAEVLEAPELDRLAAQTQHDAFTLLAPSDLREPSRVGNGREKLVVLAEGKVVELGPIRQRHALELDHESAAG